MGVKPKMFGFGNITVRNAYETIDELVELQESEIKKIEAEQSKISASKRKALRYISGVANAIVLTNDNDRYDLLSKVCKKAGLDTDFSEQVKRWTEQDEANRKEYAELEEKWGSKDSVFERAAVIKEELELSKSANSEVSEEIAAWDETASDIEEYNEKYPEYKITEENHDDFEEFKFGRWLGYYTLGMFFNSYAAPHAAYKVLGPYTEAFGDFYEDKLSIYTLKQTQKDIARKQEQEQKQYDELMSVGNHMDRLDIKYRGPEKIANAIRSSVKTLLTDNISFGHELLKKLTSDEVQEAVICAARADAYDILAPKLDGLLTEAEETKEELSGPLDLRRKALRLVASHSVSFDFNHIEDKFESARRSNENALDTVSDARGYIERYFDQRGADNYHAHLCSRADVSANVADRNFSLSDLRREIRKEIRDEEERLEAIRRAKEEAARRAREAAEAKRAAERKAQREALEASRKARQKISSNRRTTINVGGNPFQSKPSRRGTVGNAFTASTRRKTNTIGGSPFKARSSHRRKSPSGGSPFGSSRGRRR